MPFTDSRHSYGLEDQPSKREGNCKDHHTNNASAVLRTCVWNASFQSDLTCGSLTDCGSPDACGEQLPKDIKKGIPREIPRTKQVPNHRYGIRAEMDGRCGARSACGTQGESSLLTCYLHLVLSVYKEAAGFHGETAAISFLTIGSLLVLIHCSPIAHSTLC